MAAKAKKAVKGTKKKKKAAKKPRTTVKAKPGKTQFERARLHFTDDEVREIRKRCFVRARGPKDPVNQKNDLTRAQLAKQHSCTDRTIYSIATKATYAHVSDEAPKE